MLESENDPNQTQNDPNSSENSPPSEAASTDPPQFQWGNDAPAEWQGQPASVAINAYNDLLAAARELYARQNQQAPPTQEPPPVVQNVDPDLVLTDPAAWQRDLEQRVATTVDQRVSYAVAPAYTGVATAAKALSKQDPALKAYWDKFGNQIESLANNPQIDPRLRASKDFWDNAARAVASQPDNMETIIAERAATLATTAGSSTERGSGSGFMSQTELTDLDKFKETPYGKDLSAKYSDREILRQIEASGETIQSYTEKLKNTHVRYNPNNHGEWSSDLARNR